MFEQVGFAKADGKNTQPNFGSVIASGEAAYFKGHQQTFLALAYHPYAQAQFSPVPFSGHHHHHVQAPAQYHLYYQQPFPVMFVDGTYQGQEMAMRGMATSAGVMYPDHRGLYFAPAESQAAATPEQQAPVFHGQRGAGGERGQPGNGAAEKHPRAGDQVL